MARLGPFARSLVFLIVAPGTVTVLIPWLLLRALPSVAIAPALGAVLTVAGAALLLWSFFGFAFVGRATPAPFDAPRRLVVWGPYRWVRNPMYVGVLAMLVGESLVFSPWLLAYALFVAVLVYMFVRLYEEPTLSARFGAEYDRYRQRVPRWIPRPPRGGSAGR